MILGLSCGQPEFLGEPSLHIIANSAMPTFCVKPWLRLGVVAKRADCLMISGGKKEAAF